MKQKIFNVRNELIADAALRMHTLDIDAHQALEVAQAEGRSCAADTLSYAMRQYYLNVSDNGLTRLIREVEKRAKQ